MWLAERRSGVPFECDSFACVPNASEASSFLIYNSLFRKKGMILWLYLPSATQKCPCYKEILEKPDRQPHSKANINLNRCWVVRSCLLRCVLSCINYSWTRCLFRIYFCSLWWVKTEEFESWYAWGQHSRRHQLWLWGEQVIRDARRLASRAAMTRQSSSGIGGAKMRRFRISKSV